MPVQNKAVVVGAFSEMFELLELCGIDIVGYVDTKPLEKYNNYQWLGNDDAMQMLIRNYSDCGFVLTPDAPIRRKLLHDKYHSMGAKFITVVSPLSYVSKSAQIGSGCIIHSHSYISSNVILNDFVKINVKANVMHDSQIGGYSTIAPNAVILGRVTIGSLTYVGANSTIRQDTVVGSNVMVGAGAVVIKKIDDNLTVAGVPAHKLLN